MERGLGVPGQRAPRSALAKVMDVVFSHRVDRDYRVGPSEIAATEHCLPKLKSNLGEILRLMDLANVYNKRIAQKTWNTVRAAVSIGTMGVTPATARYFLSLSPNRRGWESCSDGCTTWACWKS